jgi:hypothetical protein
VLFRFQRGGLTESMATIQEFSTLEELARIVSETYPEDARSISVKPYCFDERIGWDTHIVSLGGDAIGFTDGPIH